MVGEDALGWCSEGRGGEFGDVSLLPTLAARGRDRVVSLMNLPLIWEASPGGPIKGLNFGMWDSLADGWWLDSGVSGLSWSWLWGESSAPFASDRSGGTRPEVQNFMPNIDRSLRAA